MKALPLFCSFFFTCSLLASDLYEVCHTSVMSRYSEASQLKFFQELKDKKISPAALIQVLVNDLQIYKKFEEKLRSKNHNPFLVPLYREKTIARDIYYISYAFNLRIPEATPEAKKFSETFKDFKKMQMMVGFYSLYAGLLIGSDLEKKIKLWLVENQKNNPMGGLNFYRFHFPEGQSYADILNVLKEQYSSIELTEEGVSVYTEFADSLFQEYMHVYETIYDSPYVQFYKDPKPLPIETIYF